MFDENTGPPATPPAVPHPQGRAMRFLRFAPFLLGRIYNVCGAIPDIVSATTEAVTAADEGAIVIIAANSFVAVIVALNAGETVRSSYCDTRGCWSVGKPS